MSAEIQNVKKSQLVEEWRQEGRVEERQDALMELLSLRFGTSSESICALVRAEKRLSVLHEWLERAYKSQTSEVFGQQIGSRPLRLEERSTMKSEFREMWLEEGRIEARRIMIMELLRSRLGWLVPDKTIVAVHTNSNLMLLRKWHWIALKIASVEEFQQKIDARD